MEHCQPPTACMLSSRRVLITQSTCEARKKGRLWMRMIGRKGVSLGGKPSNSLGGCMQGTRKQTRPKGPLGHPTMAVRARPIRDCSDGEKA